MPFWQAQQSLEPLQWIARGVVMFFWLWLTAKRMGQREIGRLTLFDFVIAIMLGTVAASPLASSTSSLLGAAINVAVLGVMDIAIARFSLNHPKLRRVLQEEPIVLVQNGQILEDTMRKARYNLDDLLMQLRLKNVPNLHDVEFAILEPNGKLSVIPKSQARPLTPHDMQFETPYEGMPTVLVEDGNIVEDNLRENQLSRTWLVEQLKLQGAPDPNEVMTAMLDTRGRLYVSKKNQTNDDT